MADPTESEARESLLALMSDHAVRDIGHACESCAADLDAYAEAVRATEREKVRALVERLTHEESCGCPLDYDFEEPDEAVAFFTGHTEDCPWVEARLWLAEPA